MTWDDDLRRGERIIQWLRRRKQSNPWAIPKLPLNIYDMRCFRSALFVAQGNGRVAGHIPYIDSIQFEFTTIFEDRKAKDFFFRDDDN